MTVIPQDFLKALAKEHGVSNAELEVLVLAMEGKSTAAIAKSIGISGDAVRKRFSEVYQKFQIGGRGPVKLTKLQQLLMSRYQAQLKIQDAAGSRETLASPNHQDWGDAPDVSVFYGRTDELAILEGWIVGDGCRLVALLGMAGIGKTALSVKLAKQLQGKFEYVFWRSLRQAPPLSDTLTALLQFLSNQPEIPGNEAIDSQLSSVIEHFRSSRCLVVLNGIESILRSGELAGIYREGYEEYGKFFRRIGAEPHQSCLLLTSQEKLSEISLLEGETSPVRSLKLAGLGDEAQLILKEKGLFGEKKWKELIHGYRGNPLMLKLVAITIKEVFDGDVTEFLSTTLFTRDVSDFIEQMLDRLSDLEEQIIYQMAVKKEPISFAQLQANLPDILPPDLIRAIASLRQRSLMEKSESGFTLPPAVMEVTNQLLGNR